MPESDVHMGNTWAKLSKMSCAKSLPLASLSQNKQVKPLIAQVPSDQPVGLQAP